MFVLVVGTACEREKFDGVTMLVISRTHLSVKTEPQLWAKSERLPPKICGEEGK